MNSHSARGIDDGLRRAYGYCVDFNYRSELKEVNAHNFALFDAKLDQRFAEQDAKLEKRFAEQDAKFEKRFAGIDVRFAEIRGEMKELQSHLVRWMFAFWVASTATTIAALSVFAR